jgi:hypothetical protein
MTQSEIRLEILSIVRSLKWAKDIPTLIDYSKIVEEYVCHEEPKNLNMADYFPKTAAGIDAQLKKACTEGTHKVLKSALEIDEIGFVGGAGEVDPDRWSSNLKCKDPKDPGTYNPSNERGFDVHIPHQPETVDWSMPGDKTNPGTYANQEIKQGTGPKVSTQAVDVKYIGYGKYLDEKTGKIYDTSGSLPTNHMVQPQPEYTVLIDEQGNHRLFKDDIEVPIHETGPVEPYNIKGVGPNLPTEAYLVNPSLYPYGPPPPQTETSRH